MEAVIKTLLQGITNQVMNRPDYDLEPDEPLISSGLIDSFSLVDLSLFVESHFGVSLDESELTAANFDTVNELAAAILTRKK